jgi:signal transduction histidine kinase
VIPSKSECAIRITIRDYGLRIADDSLQRIFEPFFNKQLGLGGVGLGLSIAHTVVTDLMQGKIKTENRATKGLQVTLCTPKVIQSRSLDLAIPKP